MSISGLTSSIMRRTLGSQLRTSELSTRTPFWISWYAVSLVFMILIASYLPNGTNIWNLTEADSTPAFAIGMVYLVVLLAVRIAGARYETVNLFAVAGGSLVCFTASWFLLASAWGLPTSKRSLLAGAVLGPILALLPIILSRFRALALAGLVLATAATAAVDLPRTEIEPPIATTFYPLRLTLHSELIPRTEHQRTGAIEAYGDGFLLVNGRGEFYRLAWANQADSIQSERLPLSPPFDPLQFDQSEVRITDLLLDERDGTRRLYLAHEQLNLAERCFTLQVSTTSVRTSGGSFKTADWDTIFESQPCVEAGSLRSGGHLALHPRGVLLTLGDYEIQPYAQRMDVDYGKILLLDTVGGSSVFSVGHRNPQGLLADSDGQIWSTEHGPQGGDEINLITEGSNYGWPLVSYGAAYGFDSWTDPWSVEKMVDHDTITDLVDPVHAFTPAVGISELIELVESTTFPEWSGDLMIASLHELTLFRGKRNGNKLLYFEPIFIGSRIRDLAQSKDGRLLLWTDAGEIMSLTREAFESAGSQVYHGRCMSCHDSSSQARNNGVFLDGIVGRAVASLPDYQYSRSLLELGGIWTEERLDGFLEDPAGYAPGNTMDVPGVPDPEARRALIEYLRER